MGIQGRNGSTDMTVTVEKNNLIQILQKNRDEHLRLYQEAHKVFRAHIANALDDAARRAASASAEWSRYYEGAGPRPKIPSLTDELHHLTEPQSHVEEYDRALGMLRLHTGETMTLDMTSYRCYVDDEWDWSHRTKAVFDSYTGGRN